MELHTGPRVSENNRCSKMGSWVLTEHDTCGRCHIFRLGETLECRHRNLVTQADAKPEKNLRANIPSFRRVDVQSIEQGRASSGQQPTAQLVGLQEACFHNEETAEHGPQSEKGHERKAVDAARNHRLAVDRLEVDGR